jgi:hypothetical protein
VKAGKPFNLPKGMSYIFNKANFRYVIVAVQCQEINS